MALSSVPRRCVAKTQASRMLYGLSGSGTGYRRSNATIGSCPAAQWPGRCRHACTHAARSALSTDALTSSTRAGGPSGRLAGRTFFLARLDAPLVAAQHLKVERPHVVADQADDVRVKGHGVAPHDAHGADVAKDAVPLQAERRRGPARRNRALRARSRARPCCDTRREQLNSPTSSGTSAAANAPAARRGCRWGPSSAGAGPARAPWPVAPARGCPDQKRWSRL